MNVRRPPPAVLHASPDEVEAQFYEAMQQGDLSRLMGVWADDDEVVCVHPGGGRLIGTEAIGASFEALFAAGGVPVVPEQVRRMSAAGTAVHHLVERVTVTSREGPRTAWVFATNVYLKTAQGWRMVVHHASPAAEPPPADLREPAGNTLH